MKFLIIITAMLLVGCNSSDDSSSSQEPAKKTVEKKLNKEKKTTKTEEKKDHEEAKTTKANEKRDEKLEPVTKEFGQLMVKTGEFSYQSTIKPWSSWWFPSREMFMFYNPSGLSPLEKYDEFIFEKYNRYSEATKYEEEVLYNPATTPWAGLCHAWAVASVLHPEPTYTIEKNNVALTVADQKALTLKRYENVSNLKIYGERFNGRFGNEHKDILPDQYHRLFQVLMRDKKLPVLLDYDASYPVWTVPSYKVKFKIEEESEDTLYVKSWLTIASPFVKDPNFVGTKSVIKIYEYKLYGKFDDQDKFIVTNSEWINESVRDHPDYLIYFPSNAKHGTFNKALNTEDLDDLLNLTKIEGIE